MTKLTDVQIDIIWKELEWYYPSLDVLVYADILNFGPEVYEQYDTLKGRHWVDFKVFLMLLILESGETLID